MKDQIQAESVAIIQDIYWERIFLHFLVKGSSDNKTVFVLQNLKSRGKIPLKTEAEEDGVYHLRLNIAAADIRSFLENGNWTIAYYQSESDSFVPCFVEVNLGYELDGLARIFRYGGDEFAYTVNFTSFSDDQRNLKLCIKSYFVKKDDYWRKRGSVFKTDGNKVKRYIVNIVTGAVISGLNVWYQFLSLFRSRHSLKLLLMNETNELNAGNLEAIDRRLKERGLDKKIHISYSFRQAVGKGVSLLSIWSWIKLITRIAMQDIIILDNFAPVFSMLKLRRDVELVQVWHAGGGFKAVGYCRFGKDGSPYPAKSCHKAYTTALTGSKQLIKVFEEVFGIEESSFLPVGMPRLDGYLEESNIAGFREKFYKKYPQFINKKIILFAPTYRGTGQRSAYYDYDMVDLGQIYDVCKEEYVFLIKMHPFITEPFPIPEDYKKRIYDFSEFPSINELFYVTEVLITDYSSNYYEFSLMKKPILFYTYDRHIYELTRGTYQSVKDSAPGKVCDTFEELIKALKEKDYEYEKVLRFVEENFEGVTERAADKLIDKVILKNRKYK